MKRYLEYKESEVEFIGMIPMNWDTMRCTHLFETTNIKRTSGEINLSVYRDYGVVKRDSRNDNYNRVSEDTSNYKLVNPGDFVFNRMKCWQGSLGVSEYRGIVSPSYTICEPKRRFHGKYFHYLLRSQSYIQEFKRLSYGVRIGQWELRFEDFKDIVVPYPSLSEQTQIANLLDHKTGQIDELIRIKERKIELLREQRTALINQAVTKGLDPNVEMKPSGVEWIGEIPKDWNAVPMTKYLEPIIDYRGRTPEKTEDGRFLVTAKNIRNGRIDYKISQEFTSEDNYQRIMTRGIPQIGDVLFTTEAPLGEVANVDDVSIALAQRIIKFRPEPDFLNPYFLKYWILSYSFQSNLQRYATGSTAQGIKASKLCLLKLNLPPLKEQKQIVDYLDQKTQETNELIAAEQRKIELLKEYRQSLISDAVTGKIDVRNEV